MISAEVKCLECPATFLRKKSTMLRCAACQAGRRKEKQSYRNRKGKDRTEESKMTRKAPGSNRSYRPRKKDALQFGMDNVEAMRGAERVWRQMVRECQ